MDDDNDFLRAFLRGWPAGEPFGHYEHLRIAWLVIERHGPELAADMVGERLRAMGPTAKRRTTTRRSRGSGSGC